MNLCLKALLKKKVNHMHPYKEVQFTKKISYMYTEDYRTGLVSSIHFS